MIGICVCTPACSPPSYIKNTYLSFIPSGSEPMPSYSTLVNDSCIILLNFNKSSYGQEKPALLHKPQALLPQLQKIVACCH
jgi:hypothetical protein